MADESTNENRNDRRVAYLTGDSVDAPLDPFDQAELDAMLATLSTESSWADPSPDLGDRIVAEISGLAGNASASQGRMQPRPRGRSHRRGSRSGWIGPALLGAAAAGMIVFAVTRADRVEAPEAAVDATIQLEGTELAPGLTGSAEIDRRESGLWIRLALPGLPRRDDGEFYEAWLRSEDGNGLVPIGTFHEADDVILWAGVAIEDFPILTVTRESVAGPKDPSQGSSGEVVAKGRFTP